MNTVASRNVVTVRRFLDLVFTSTDEALALTAPDFTYDMTRSRNVDLSGVHEGRQAGRRLIDNMKTYLPNARFEVLEAIDLGGDHVVTVSRLSGSGASSGAAVLAVGAQLWTLRDGVPVRAVLFQSKEEALAAAESGTDAPEPN